MSFKDIYLGAISTSQGGWEKEVPICQSCLDFSLLVVNHCSGLTLMWIYKTREATMIFRVIAQCWGSSLLVSFRGSLRVSIYFLSIQERWRTSPSILCGGSVYQAPKCRLGFRFTDGYGSFSGSHPHISNGGDNEQLSVFQELVKCWRTPKMIFKTTKLGLAGLCGILL